MFVHKTSSFTTGKEESGVFRGRKTIYHNVSLENKTKSQINLVVKDIERLTNDNP